MTSFALNRTASYDGCRTVLVRSEAKLRDLLDLAQHGDTLHRVNISSEAAVVMTQINEQLKRGEFKQI